MLSTRSIDSDYLTMREAEVQSLRRMLSVLSADLAEAEAKAAQSLRSTTKTNRFRGQ